MDGSIRRQILAAYEASRKELPPVGEVRARPNVSRLASLSLSRARRRGFPRTRTTARRVLNLSTAVVEAGPKAWRLVAPALEGDRESLHQLRSLTRSGVERNRLRKDPSGGASGSGSFALAGSAPPGTGLPDTSCDGTPDERLYLLQLIEFTRSTSGHSEAIPEGIQLRISRRMTSRLGLFAHRGESYRITVSQRLFRPGLEPILWDTVKHELAHLADLVTSPDRRTSHGPRWREWARRLGARPERLCTPEEARTIQRRSGSSTNGPGRGLTYPPEVARWLTERSG
jgi:hypothetical protein